MNTSNRYVYQYRQSRRMPQGIDEESLAFQAKRGYEVRKIRHFVVFQNDNRRGRRFDLVRLREQQGRRPSQQKHSALEKYAHQLCNRIQAAS